MQSVDALARRPRRIWRHSYGQLLAGGTGRASLLSYLSARRVTTVAYRRRLNWQRFPVDSPDGFRLSRIFRQGG